MKVVSDVLNQRVQLETKSLTEAGGIVYRAEKKRYYSVTLKFSQVHDILLVQQIPKINMNTPHP